MKNPITVSLGDNQKLIVDPIKCEINQNPAGQIRIRWKLNDGGTNARFILGTDNQGYAFEWDDENDNAIFDDHAMVLNDGKTMQMLDRHKNNHSIRPGQHYTLRVRAEDGSIYETERNTAIKTGRHPVIINK
jgi:hypothetical protein